MEDKIGGKKIPLLIVQEGVFYFPRREVEAMDWGMQDEDMGMSIPLLIQGCFHLPRYDCGSQKKKKEIDP